MTGRHGHAARAELIRRTLAELAGPRVTSEADRHAAGHLRERLEAEAAWHASGNHCAWCAASSDWSTSSATASTCFRTAMTTSGVTSPSAWRPCWRASIELGLEKGLSAARRQALETAAQAERCAGVHDVLVTSYGDGWLAGELAEAAASAHAAYTATAHYLRADYAPRVAERDGVGAERHAVAAQPRRRHRPGRGYAWGWAELERIEAEIAAEVERVRPGASWEATRSSTIATAWSARTPTGAGCRTSTTGPSANPPTPPPARPRHPSTSAASPG